MSNTTISPLRSNLFQTSQIASNYGLDQMAFIASMGGLSLYRKCLSDMTPSSLGGSLTMDIE